jgi:hypothetical protein
MLDFIQHFVIFINMENNIQKEKEAYLKNKAKYLKPIEKKIKGKIIKCDFIENNEVFDDLMRNISHYQDFGKVLTIESGNIHSLVETNKGWTLKYHNCITFFMPDGSHIRFSPCQEGIEITRLYVKDGHQGYGLGTYLMVCFFNFINQSVGYTPDITAELTGSVGFNQNLIVSDMVSQTEYYMKFGFIPTLLESGTVKVFLHSRSFDEMNEIVEKMLDSIKN